MAWKFPISTNTAIDLGTTDDVYVAHGVVIGAVGATAIYGDGVDHQIEINGTLATDNNAIMLDCAVTATVTSDISIGKAGHLISKGSVAVLAYGVGYEIDNEGEIICDGYGAYVFASNGSGLNTITNSGSLYGGVNAIVTVSGAGAATKILNTGTIEGGTLSFSDGEDNITIVNKGKVIGGADLGGGADKYDGRAGSIKGLVDGGAGADAILGGKENNTFLGGAGVDKLQGGLGADKLTGGNDADLFIFKSMADSTVASAGRDTILDFSHAAGDTIDLHSIDARTTKSGDQAFKFIDSQAFHDVAGELRFQKTSTDTFISGDVNGDGKADFSIKLTGLVTLSASDFIL